MPKEAQHNVSETETNSTTETISRLTERDTLIPKRGTHDPIIVSNQLPDTVQVKETTPEDSTTKTTTTLNRESQQELKDTTSKVAVPPKIEIFRNSKPSPAQKPKNIDFFCNLLMGYILHGRLQQLPRIVSIIGHLEPVVHTDRKFLSTQDDDEPLCIVNLFSPHIVHEVFTQIGNNRTHFTFDNIMESLNNNNYTKIIEQSYLPLSPQSVVIPFLLLLLSIKFQVSLKDIAKITQILLKVRHRGTQCTYFSDGKDGIKGVHPELPLPKLVDAILERQLRFFDGGKNNERYSKQTMLFNELFEQGRLQFLKITTTTTTTNYSREKNFKTHSEKSLDLDHQLECLARIKNYAREGRFSETVVEDNLFFLVHQFGKLDEMVFTEENVDTLVNLVRSYVDGKIENGNIPEFCFNILARWALDKGGKVKDQKLKEQKISEFVSIIKDILGGNHTIKNSNSNFLFSHCILFLGSCTGTHHVIKDECYHLITSYMQQKPEAFMNEKYLSVVLTGIGLVMVTVDNQKLVEISELLLDLWNKTQTDKLPCLVDGLQLFSLFSTVYNSRKSGLSLKFAAAIKDDEWLNPLASVCLGYYSLSRKPAPRIMALFAAGGLYKGVLSSGHIRQKSMLCTDTLNSIVTSAVLQVPEESEDYKILWQQTVALICVNTDKAFPQVDDSVILSIVSEVYTRDVFNMATIIREYLAKNSNRKEVVVKLMKQKKNALFSSANIFTVSLSQLFNHVSPEDRSAFLQKIRNFVFDIYDNWRIFLEKKNSSTMDVQFEEQIYGTFKNLYLSSLILISNISSKVTGLQAGLLFEILSYLEFFSNKFSKGQDFNFHTQAIQTLLPIWAKHNPNYLENIIHLVEVFRDDSQITAPVLLSPLLTSDIMLNSRIRFVLRVFEIVLESDTIAYDEEQLRSFLEKKLLPICFLLIKHPDRGVNIKAHGIFQKLISRPEPIREEVIPYYLKQSLQHYPELTQIEPFAKSAVTLVTKLPPSNPLVLHCLKSIEEKVKSEPEKGPPYMTILFFEMITHVHRHSLSHILGLVEELIVSAPQKMRILLCQLLFWVISKNYDYTRKETCIKWYLELCAKLGINKPNL